MLHIDLQKGKTHENYNYRRSCLYYLQDSK